MRLVQAHRAGHHTPTAKLIFFHTIKNEYCCDELTKVNTVAHGIVQKYDSFERMLAAIDAQRGRFQ